MGIIEMVHFGAGERSATWSKQAFLRSGPISWPITSGPWHKGKLRINAPPNLGSAVSSLPLVGRGPSATRRTLTSS